MEIASVDASGTPTNNILASTAIPSAAVPTDQFTTITGNFAPNSAATVVQGNKYALVLHTPDTKQNSWSFRDGDPCAEGALYQAFSGGGFSAGGSGSWDANFAVYVTPLPPPNDDFANAQAINGSTASVNGKTAAATRESGEPDHYTSDPADASWWVGDHSVWYSWKAPASGSTTIDTCQANIDSILAVYTGSQLSSLTRVADNNNHPDCPSGSWGSKVTFNAQSGTTYRLAVGDAGGLRESTFTLNLVAPADTTAPRVKKVVPAENATGIAPGTNISAFFSEDMRGASINTNTIKLFKAGTTDPPLAAVVSYDAAKKKAILNPDANLQRGAKYKAVVSTWPKDLAGNRLDQNPTASGNQPKKWFFTVKN